MDDDEEEEDGDDAFAVEAGRLSNITDTQFKNMR